MTEDIAEDRENHFSIEAMAIDRFFHAADDGPAAMHM